MNTQIKQFRSKLECPCREVADKRQKTIPGARETITFSMRLGLVGYLHKPHPFIISDTRRLFSS